jgi:hypothetical protein
MVLRQRGRSAAIVSISHKSPARSVPGVSSRSTWLRLEPAVDLCEMLASASRSRSREHRF